MSKPSPSKAKQTRLTDDGRLEDAPEKEIVKVASDYKFKEVATFKGKPIQVHPDQMPLFKAHYEVSECHQEVQADGSLVVVIDKAKLISVSRIDHDN